MFRIRSIGEKIAGAGRSTALPRSGRAARAGLGRGCPVDTSQPQAEKRRPSRQARPGSPTRGSATRGSDFGGCGRDNALAGEDVDVGAVFE